MTILVVGGAGYIGSHMVQRLCEEGETPVVLDNLSTGHRDAVSGGIFVHGDCGNEETVKAVVQAHRIGTVMHFAASIQAGESAGNPLKYYGNNVAKTLTLLKAIVALDVKQFVFSSSAAVYGNAQTPHIAEDHACLPVNPYGRTKRMIELVLEDLRAAHALRFFAFRYFNAAGADALTRLGERHDPETHLIPLVLQAASGRREAITVFGRDYDTPDGTCIRDYVHVEDLCEAHLLAIQTLRRGGDGGFYNLGSGGGHTVAEVIDMARRVTGRAIEVIEGERRPGDPAMLVAKPGAMVWRPKRADLATMVEHAWKWERNTAGRR